MFMLDISAIFMFCKLLYNVRAKRIMSNLKNELSLCLENGLEYFIFVVSTFYYFLHRFSPHLPLNFVSMIVSTIIYAFSVSL